MTQLHHNNGPVNTNSAHKRCKHAFGARQFPKYSNNEMSSSIQTSISSHAKCMPKIAWLFLAYVRVYTADIIYAYSYREMEDG